MKPTWRPGRWLIILPPLIFLLIFFLIPFAFAFKISFAEAVPRVPPFSDVIFFTADHHLQLAIHLGNYRYLLTDEVYGVAYLYSLRTAFFSTLICVALGWPMAYAMAPRPSRSSIAAAGSSCSRSGFRLLLTSTASKGVHPRQRLPSTPCCCSFGLIRHHCASSLPASRCPSASSTPPPVHRPATATLRKLDRRCSTAAALGSTPRRPFLDIALPLSVPSMIAGSMLMSLQR